VTNATSTTKKPTGYVLIELAGGWAICRGVGLVQRDWRTFFRVVRDRYFADHEERDGRPVERIKATAADLLRADLEREGIRVEVRS
jgi:hypothetical protein